MTNREVFKRIRRAERKRTGINVTRWYSSVHPKRNGEAEVRTWAVKTYKGKPLILLASVYPTTGVGAKVSGRCLVSMWDNYPHWNWLDYGGKSHVAVWSDVDGSRNEMLDPANDHQFKRGIEFYGLGEFVNGFEHTKYEYGCFRESGLRLSDWLDCMRITPKTEIVIKAGLFKWLDTRYLPTLADNGDLVKFVRNGGEKFHDLAPFRTIQMFRRTGGELDFSRAQKIEQERKEREIIHSYGFGSLVFKPRKILNWLDKYAVKPEALRHHIDNIHFLGIDDQYEPHILPKDFATYSLEIEERVHAKVEADRIAAEAEAMENERIARKARIYARKTIRKWLAEGKIHPKFSVIIPSSQTEMVTEGRTMKNCIGGYWGRSDWKQGKTEVAFIHLDGKPYIDVEFRDGKIIQARYKKNEAVSEGTKDYAMCQFVTTAFKAFKKVA